MASAGELIEKFSKMPLPHRAGIIVATAAVVFAAFYFFFYSDVVDQQRVLKSKIGALESEKSKHEERKQKYLAFRADVNRLLEEQKELMKILPEEANISVFLQAIHTQAALAGLNIQTYDQKREKKRKFYAQIPVKMAVNGTYHQIKKFFYSIERNLKRIVEIKDLRLGTPRQTDQGVSLRASFVASTFRFLAKKKAKKKKKKG